MTRSDVLRFSDWTKPVVPVTREVISVVPDTDEGHPPVLFVPGLGHGAWAFAEHWLAHTAGRGFAAHAMSLRGHGGSGGTPRAGLRAYAHDVVQVAAALPRQTVLVGHGAGALVVARALARYPARAAVLLAPVLDGWSGLGSALRANPVGTLPAAFGGRLRLSRRQLFSRGLPAEQAVGYRSRLTGAGAVAQWQLLAHRAALPPVGHPPVLVVGSPDDRVVSRKSLDRTAGRYGGAPLLFPGMGHDLMLDEGWQEPIDAILDWLDKELVAPPA
jgi:pimeloyl-ACP methyl ester carboxylesterase